MGRVSLDVSGLQPPFQKRPPWVVSVLQTGPDSQALHSLFLALQRGVRGMVPPHPVVVVNKSWEDLLVSRSKVHLTGGVLFSVLESWVPEPPDAGPRRRGWLPLWGGFSASLPRHQRIGLLFLGRRCDW